MANNLDTMKRVLFGSYRSSITPVLGENQLELMNFLKTAHIMRNRHIESTYHERS